MVAACCGDFAEKALDCICFAFGMNTAESKATASRCGDNKQQCERNATIVSWLFDLPLRRLGRHGRYAVSPDVAKLGHFEVSGASGA